MLKIGPQSGFTLQHRLVNVSTPFHAIPLKYWSFTSINMPPSSTYNQSATRISAEYLHKLSTLIIVIMPSNKSTSKTISATKRKWVHLLYILISTYQSMKYVTSTRSRQSRANTPPANTRKSSRKGWVVSHSWFHLFYKYVYSASVADKKMTDSDDVVSIQCVFCSNLIVLFLLDAFIHYSPPSQ